MKHTTSSNQSQITSPPRMFTVKRLKSITENNYGQNGKEIFLSKLKSESRYVIQPFQTPSTNVETTNLRTMVFDMNTHEFIGIIDISQDQWNYGIRVIWNGLD